MEDFKFLKGFTIDRTIKKYRSMRHDWPTLKQYIKDNPTFAGKLVEICCPISMSVSEYFRGVSTTEIILSDIEIEILFKNREL